jgi:hypothetical protein
MIASGYERKTGKKLDITHTPRAILKENYSKNSNDFMSFLKLTWDEGHGTVGLSTNNDEWPEWKPKKVLDVLA